MTDYRATAYCDGACIGNPGPGGWGVVIEIPGVARGNIEFAGGRAQTTNNVMEMAAAYAAVSYLKKIGATTFVVCSDSQYLIQGMRYWVKTWATNGWRTSQRQPVANQEAWRALLKISEGLDIQWVRTSDADEPELRRAHDLARAAVPLQGVHAAPF